MDCGFRVAFPPFGRVCFADRAAEARHLLGLVERGAGLPLVVYGPEGSGKSTLLRYVAWRVEEAGGVSVYIDALAEGEVGDAVYPGRRELLRAALEAVGGAAGGPVGRLLAERLGRLVELLVERLSLRGRAVFVAVDDVYQALGVERAEAYTKRLYGLVHRLYEAGASSVLVVAATSEGLSRRRLARHGYLVPSMMWNMPLEGFRELVGQVEARLGFEALWRLLGGNPRGLSQLATLGWSVERMLQLLVEERVSPAAERVGLEALARLVADPDSDPEAAMVLEEYNLVMRLSRSSALGEPPPRDPLLGVGERWAWQMPALRMAAERLVERTGRWLQA